jgi:hypothetical protein
MARETVPRSMQERATKIIERTLESYGVRPEEGPVTPMRVRTVVPRELQQQPTRMIEVRPSTRTEHGSKERSRAEFQ